jgi:DNA-binding MurR/RpiR family transcriptional regulator
VLLLIIDKLNDVLNSNDHQSTTYIISLYVKKHIHQIYQMTIKEVASQSFVSKGQISKYVKSLGFNSYGEFKTACLDYCESLTRRNVLFSEELSLVENSFLFTSNVRKIVEFASQNIDYSILEYIINDISRSKRLYIYAQGDARSLCNLIQIEFSTFYKEVFICDVDFLKEYNFKKEDLLIILSVNGQSFYYDQRIMRRIGNSNVDMWLITCHQNIDFPKNILTIPSNNQMYNEYALRHILDIIIARLQLKQTKKFP